MTDYIVIRAVPVADTRPLRRAILRPHQQIHELHYPGDDDHETCHFAAFQHEDMVGCASVYHQPVPGEASDDAWRLRAMATTDSVRGTGVGGQLLRRCLQYVIENKGRTVWCNARTPAAWFYEHYGFTTRGDEFELPGIGPHYLMIKQIADDTN